MSGESLGVEWGSDRALDSMNAKASSFSRLAGNSAQGVTGGKMVHSLRSIGSAALNYGMVAGGGLDLYWYFFLSFYPSWLESDSELVREIGCWPWDVCAGIVIAEEAGCVITGSHDTFATTSSSENFGIVTEEILTGRKYLVVRAIGDSKVSLMNSTSIPSSPYLRFQLGRNRFRSSETNYQRILRDRGGCGTQLITPLRVSR